MSSLPQHAPAYKTQTKAVAAIFAALLLFVFSLFGAVPVYLRGTTKPIGRVSGAIFEKTVQGSKHFLRVPMPALGFDLSTLEDAERAGAVFVAVTDCETRRTYRQRIETIRRYGFDVTRGYGRQIALPLGAYAIDGKPP